MNFAQTASLCILIAGTGAIWAASEARAQGAPAFQSDVERQDREREAQRAERRKSYGPVVYPKFMDGGAKPDIAPEKPPVVYLENGRAVCPITQIAIDNALRSVRVSTAPPS